MKYLIINADDFGICESVNIGIVESMQCGKVTDLSFLINPDELDSSLNLLERIGKRSVGFHLNLTSGKSVLGAASKLTNEDGCFFDLKVFCKKILLNLFEPKYLYNEIKQQIDVLIRNGFSITHVDSHRNIHLIPRIAKTLLRIMNEYKIDVPLRMPSEKLQNILIFRKWNALRAFILKSMVMLCRRSTTYKNHIETIGCDLYNNPQLDTAFLVALKYITKSPASIFEIPVHPGYPSDDLSKYDSYTLQRKRELNFLKNNNDLNIDSAEIHLVSFDDVCKSSHFFK